MTDKENKPGPEGEAPLGELELYPNAGRYLAEVLVEHGVEVAFGVSGGHIWQLVDEMSNAGIKIVTVRHEQSAGLAAEAYSKVTGKPGVCFVTVGPGVGNVFGSIQQAYQSNSPVLLIAGGNDTVTDYLPTIQPSYIRDSMQHVTKYCRRCTDAATIKQNVTRAFMHMQSYPKGPAALEFSSFMLIAPVPPKAPKGFMGQHALYIPQWRREETGTVPMPAGDPAMVEKAVKMLMEAKRPLIYAGDGTHWAGAGPELLEFAELMQIPVTTRRIARGCFPEDHCLYLDSRTGRSAIQESDIRLSLGAKIGVFDEWGRGWPPTIQVNESWEQIWTYIDTPVAIVGNIKTVLKQMIEYVKLNKLTPPADRQVCVDQCCSVQEGGTEKRRALAEKYAGHTPIHYGYLSKRVWDFCESRYGGKNRIVIDGYTMADYLPAFIRAKYSGQIMDASEYANIGHGVGMSIGAAFADPDARKQPILAVMGDAGMGISGMDYETALIHKLPIVFLVTENRGWLTGMKHAVYGKNWEAMGEQDRGHGQEGVDNARYDKICEIFGGHGEHVAAPEDIEPALARAFESAEKGIPAIVNVHVDPRVHNRQLLSPSYVACWNHIPWKRLAPRAKAARRVFGARMFPFDKHGIPEMTLPNSWEPVKDDEDFTVKS